MILFYYWKETPESVRKLYVSPHDTFMTHTKGNFDQIRNTRRAFCSHLIIKLSSSFIFCCDVPLTPLKGSTMISPTGVRFRFNAGTTHKLYSLTDGRQKSSGRPGFFFWGGGGERGYWDKAIDAFEEAITRSNNLNCTQEQQTSLFADQFSGEFWTSEKKSYKSAIKNRRQEKSIPDVLIAFISKKLSYYLYASLRNGDSIFAGKCAQNYAKNNFNCENAKHGGCTPWVIAS